MPDPATDSNRVEVEKVLTDTARQYEEYLHLAEVARLGRARSDADGERSGWRDLSHPLEIAIKTGPTNALLESAPQHIPGSS